MLHQRSIERVERTLLEQFVHDLGIRGKRIEAVATQGSLPVRGWGMGPSRRASTDLPLGWPVSTVVRRPVTESAPLVPWATPGEARLPLAAPRRAAAISHFPPDAQGAIAKLIEHTARPVRLPGLELRLVSPEKQPFGTRRSAAVAPDEGQTTAAAPLQPPAPAAPSPLDINAISEKVYDRLLRRQRLEREWRGLY